NMRDVAQTPFHGSLAIRHLDVASTGFIDPKSGIAALLDFDGTLASDGTVLATKGKGSATGVKLLPGAAASSVPIAMDYESSFNSKTQAGTLKKADISIGKATAAMSGDYRVT